MKGRSVLACLAVFLMAVPAFLPLSGAIYIGPRVKLDIGDTTLNERAATTVLVTVYNETGVLVPGATVNIVAEAGTFDQGSRTTGATGVASFIYTAPTVVLEQRMVNITATAVYDIPPYTEATKAIWLLPVPKVYIDGPDQVVKGGEVVRYTVRAVTGSEPLTGGVLNVTPPTLGTIVQNQQATDGTGRAWFEYRPPADQTGETTLSVSVTLPGDSPVSGSRTIQVVDEITTMIISVATDKDPVPCWGSSNLTATVRKGNQTVAGATVEWVVTLGLKSASTTRTDESGRSRIQYTATNATGQLWAGTVTVIARATSGADRADTNITFEVAPYAVTWAAELVYSSTGGQLLAGETLSVNLSLRLARDRPWEFITPVSVDLKFWSSDGTVLYNRSLAHGLTILPGLDWSSGPIVLLTVPAVPTIFQYRWQVRVLSNDSSYTYYQIPDPVEVSILREDVANWTILMYICDNNNLWKFIFKYLNDLENGGPEGQYRFLLQHSGSFSGTWRMELIRDVDGSHLNSIFLQNMTARDLGDPEELLDFLKWGSEVAPAKNYCVIIVDHGGAWEGVCWDDSHYPATHISVASLESALKRFSAHARKPGLLFMEACLMSSLEAVGRLKDCAQYIYASEVIVWTDSLMLTPTGLLKAQYRLDNGSMTPAQLADDLLDGYLWKRHLMYPIGITDLRSTGPFWNALNSMVEKLLAKWPVMGPLLQEASTQAYPLAGVDGGAIRTIIDLKTLLESLYHLIEQLPMSYRYAELLFSIDDTLQELPNIFYRRSLEEWPLENGLGALNVFFPETSSYYNFVRSEYIASCPEDLAWPRLLDALYYTPPGSQPLRPWPNLAGFNMLPLQEPRLEAVDSNSDGIIESATADIQADQRYNDLDININIDTILINGTLGEGDTEWAGRQVVTVPAGTDLSRSFEISSPSEDPVMIVVTVVAPDGTILQQYDLGTFRLVPKPRTGNPPMLKINASSVEVREGRQVNFTATVTDPEGDKVDVWWDTDLSDGLGLDAVGPSVAAAYRVVGNRTVTCIASDGMHVVVEQLDINVTANPDNRKPAANLTFSFTGPYTVFLNATGSSDPDGDALEYQFVFDDGNTTGWSNRSTAAHTYPNGTYECFVMVRDGCRYNGSCALVTVNVTGQAPQPANRAPAARFVVISNLMGAKKPIGFDASISSDPDNDALQYRFDWGDGNMTEWSSSKTTNHTYAMPGTYNVTLTVRDAGNLSASNTTKIVVKPAPKTIAPKGFIPGPGLAAAVIAFAAACALGRKRYPT